VFCTFASSFSFAVSFRSGLIVLRGGQRGFGGGQGIFRRGQGSLCGVAVSFRSSLRVLGAKKKPPKHSRVSEEERCIYR